MTTTIFFCICHQFAHHCSAFCCCFQELVTKWINSRRSEADAGVKKAMQVWLDKDGNAPDSLPTVGEILASASRALDPHNPRHVQVFKFYWHGLLPGACGKELWDEKTRKWEPIFSQKLEVKGEEKLAITTSTEAFVVTSYENCRDLLVLRAKWPKGVEVPKKGNKTKDDPYYKHKWTSAFKGQSLYGGWAQEGRKKFNQNKAHIRVEKAKVKREDLEKLELDFLEVFKKEMSVCGSSKKEHDDIVKQMKKNPRQQVVPKKEEAPVSTFDAADDE